MKLDVRVENHGSIWLFCLHTSKARKWVEENVQTSPWQWQGNALACEHRYGPDLVEGMRDAGLVVGR